MPCWTLFGRYAMSSANGVSGSAACEGSCSKLPEGHMCKEAGFAEAFPRLHELQALTGDQGNYGAYFHREFDEAIKAPGRHRAWSARELELEVLDEAAWKLLKEKVRSHLSRLDREGRGWQQLIETLNEASAYGYMKDTLGCRHIRFIPEDKTQTPDLEADCETGPVICEVKTISESDAEIEARVMGTGVYSSRVLGEKFLAKLSTTIARATEQLTAYRSDMRLRRVVFLILNFDDGLGEYNEEYYREIDAHLSDAKIGTELVFFNRWTPFHSNIAMENALVLNEAAIQFHKNAFLHRLRSHALRFLSPARAHGCRGSKRHQR
jgi:hypothetical protein